MENGPFSDDFPNKTSMYNGFSIAMLNYQRLLVGFLTARHIQDLRVLGDLPQGGAHHHRQVDLAQGTAVEHRIEA